MGHFRRKRIPKQITEVRFPLELKEKQLCVGVYVDEKNKIAFFDFRIYIERKEFSTYTQNGVRLQAEFLEPVKKAIAEIEPILKAEQEKLKRKI